MERNDYVTPKIIDEHFTKIILPSVKLSPVTVLGIPSTGVSGIIRYLTDCYSSWSNILEERSSRHVYLSISVENLKYEQALAEREAVVSLKKFVQSNREYLDKNLVLFVHNVPATVGLSELVYSLITLLGGTVTLIFTDTSDLFSQDIQTRDSLATQISKYLRVNSSKTSTIFQVSKEIETKTIPTTLSTIILANQYYHTLSSIDDVKHYLVHFSNLNGIAIPSNYPNKIYKLCQGDGSLTKHFANLLVNNQEKVDKLFSINRIDELYELIGKDLLDTRFWMIINSLTNSTREWIINRNEIVPVFLRNTQLFVDKRTTPLFEHFISCNRKQIVNFTKSSDLLESTIDIKTLLTGQELALYSLLIENKGRIVSKQTIAQSIWGKEWQEYFSLWAFDKLVSNLSIKLREHTNYSVKSVKKKGVILL